MPRRAAELIASDLVRRQELKRAGVRDPYSDQHDRPLEEHFKDFETTMKGRGSSPATSRTGWGA